MFKIGELVVYSEHGVCKIDDISDKTYGGKTRTYYVLHPIEDPNLKINLPVHNDKLIMTKIMDGEEAKEIIQSFHGQGVEWILDVRERNKQYNSMVQTGNRIDIGNVVNTLMRKKNEADHEKKKLAEQDRKLLTKTQHILFEELAIALNKSYEEIDNKIQSLIKPAS